MTAAPQRRLWVFNLDAELELERCRSGGPYQAPLRVRQALAPMLPHAQRVMAPGDVALDDLEVSEGAPGASPAATTGAPSPWLGAAWCPTPSALRRLSRAGAALPAHPSLEILHAVNHRRFYLELGGGAPGARYVGDAGELRATLTEPGPWLFKRPFGFAGRGQRRILGTPSADDERWLADSVRLGGVLAEPWLDVTLELGLHGWLDASGRWALGDVCVQETNVYRAWSGTRLATAEELEADEIRQLRTRAEDVAEALAHAGYFGPFGIDAYRYATPGGTLRLNALSELNARYSMGYPIGMARSDGRLRELAR